MAMLRDLSPDDWFLLLESDRPGGQFYYAGRILRRLDREAFDLSLKLWGEARYPIIFFLDGQLTNFPWERFRDDFGYKEGWRLATA
jgi:hypothetical protein